MIALTITITWVVKLILVFIIGIAGIWVWIFFLGNLIKISVWVIKKLFR